MEQERTVRGLPPLVSSWNTPEEIIGRKNMSLFMEHYQICQDAKLIGDFPEKKLKDKIGNQDRVEIAKVYIELRKNGYIPNGLDQNGNIRWAVVQKSEFQQIFEKTAPELDGMSREELQQIARDGFRFIRDRKNVVKQMTEGEKTLQEAHGW